MLAEQIIALMDADTEDFVQLAKIAGLGPDDFVGFDFDGVDLRNTDLSDYDLAHADLSGAIIDETTTLPSIAVRP